MHVLFLNSWYPSKIFPTNGDFIQRHAECVADLHKVTCVHVISDPLQTKDIIITDNIINDIRTRIAYIRPTSFKFLKFFRFFKAYLKLIANLPAIDFVHVNHIYPAGIIALYLKYTKGIEFIISEHWTGFHKTNTLPWKGVMGWIMRKVAHNAKYISPVTLDLAKAMTKLGLKGRYKPVPNVVNTDLFDPVDNQSKCFTILHISNMKDDHKNISGLIRTIGEFNRSVTDFKFIMIGDRPERYRNLLVEAGIENVKFELVDNISQEKLVTYMHKANVFVLFSNEENLPCVILESFSCGVPVISTDVGGINEFFPPDFGSLIDKGDENELLRELKNMYEGKKIYSTPAVMHSYAKMNFSKTNIANMFSRLYE